MARRSCLSADAKQGLKTEWIEKRWAVIRMYGFTKLPLSSWEKQLSIQSGGRIRYESWRPRYMDVYGLPRRKLCARSASVISNYINTHQTLIGILVSIIICTIMSTFFFVILVFNKMWLMEVWLWLIPHNISLLDIKNLEAPLVYFITRVKFSF